MTQQNILDSAHLLEPIHPTGRTAVVAPGREGGPGALPWLTDRLLAAGVRVVGVEYSTTVRSILQDPEDVRIVAEAIATDSEPPILIGYSRGGCAVLNAAGLGAPASAIVAISAASDQARLMYGYRLHAPGSRRVVALEARGAEPEEDPLLYRDASPIYKSDRIAQPVLFVHGDNDLIIPIDHSWWMRDALVAAGNLSVSHVAIPRAGHYFEVAFDESRTSDVADAVVGWIGVQPR